MRQNASTWDPLTFRMLFEAGKADLLSSGVDTNTEDDIVRTLILDRPTRSVSPKPPKHTVVDIDAKRRYGTGGWDGPSPPYAVLSKG